RSAAVVGGGGAGGPGGEEVALADLADVVGRQRLRPQPPGGRNLEVGEVAGGEVPQLGHRDGAVGVDDDGGGNDLAEIGVGAAADGHLPHRRMLEQHVLDVGGGDILAAPDDEVLQPAGDEVVPAGVDVAEVARVDPPVRIDDAVGGLAPVAEHLGRRAGHDFAGALLVGPVDAQLHHRERPPGGAGPLHEVPPRGGGQGAAALREEVDVRDAPLDGRETGLEAGDELGEDGRPAEGDGPHRREVAALDGRVVQHAADHRRHAAPAVHAFRFHEVEDLGRVEAAGGEHQRPAEEQLADQ